MQLRLSRLDSEHTSQGHAQRTSCVRHGVPLPDLTPAQGEPSDCRRPIPRRPTRDRSDECVPALAHVDRLILKTYPFCRWYCSPTGRMISFGDLVGRHCRPHVFRTVGSRKRRAPNLFVLTKDGLDACPPLASPIGVGVILRWILAPTRQLHRYDGLRDALCQTF